MTDKLDLWLRLASVPRLGGKRIQQLLQRIPLNELPFLTLSELIQLGLSEKQSQHFCYSDKHAIEQARLWAEHPEHHLVTLGCASYPPLLKEIASPPPILFIKGQMNSLSQPQVAIVGSRHASLDARELAFEFSQALVSAGYSVTSGLALGIDGEAHHGALKAGGCTLAVLGSGVDRIYPSAHRPLAEAIIEQGAIISEFWPTTAPKPQNFPRRNRIISGLSVGVLVVEAAEKSGSLITARYALDQGREVFAMPSSIRDGANRGGHQLIKSGAKLVETPIDIIEDIGSLTECVIDHQIAAQRINESETLPFSTVLATVGSTATAIDVVAERCKLPVHEVMMQLLELELLGAVSSVPGGYVRVRRGEL